MLGGADQLKEKAIKAYNFALISAQQQQDQEEESKQAAISDETQANLVKKVGTIIDSLTVKKAAPKAGGFRSFMKTAKTELQQMNIEAKPLPEGAASAAPVGGEAGMGGGFSATVAVPKTGQNQNLIHVNMTEEPTQLQGDTAISAEASPATP